MRCIKSRVTHECRLQRLFVPRLLGQRSQEGLFAWRLVLLLEWLVWAIEIRPATPLMPCVFIDVERGLLLLRLVLLSLVKELITSILFRVARAIGLDIAEAVLLAGFGQVLGCTDARDVPSNIFRAMTGGGRSVSQVNAYMYASFASGRPNSPRKVFLADVPTLTHK